jgi:hypothetical protein
LAGKENEMNDPQSVTLKQVTFHDDLKTLSYQFMLDGQSRTVSYRFDGNKSVDVDVREKSGGEPFIQLRATSAGIRARTPEGEFKLTRRKPVLPPSTDQLSVWLLAQDFVKNTSTAPRPMLDRFLAAWSAANGAGGAKQASSRWGDVLGVPGAVWDTIQLLDWLFGDGDCLNPNQQTQCTETDANGQDTTITFQCECGMPICNQSGVAVNVTVIVTDSSTGEQHIETETVMTYICFCYCIVIGSGSPG